MIVQRLELDGGHPGGVWMCPGCRAVLTDGTLEHNDRCPEMAPGRDAELISRLRANVRAMQVSLERKNRLLDALHYVWCDGGCPRGVHRWSDALVTRELVEAAERNARRLRRWYRTVEFRLRLPGADEWQRRRHERAAARTDLLDDRR